MTTVQKKPVNYLNNKDILKEIHASKTSFCAFSRQEYHQYDLIIEPSAGSWAFSRWLPPEKTVSFDLGELSYE